MHVPFYRHGLRAEDARAIADVLNSRLLTGGEVGHQVEKQLCDFFDAPFALLGNSWTNSAIAVLLALDIKAGDEIIVPAQSFVASANVIELIGAKPVFVDVDPVTLLMTPQSVQRAMNRRVRAVIPVHLYGLMCDVRGIRDAVGDEVAILEDCAHCFEGLRDGEPPGRYSDAAVFSFYATKNVTCGEGGAVITHREDLHVLIRQTMSHGVSPSARERFSNKDYVHWDMVRLGGKATLSDIHAALLGPQIANVRASLKLRAKLAARYEEAFAGMAIRCSPTLSNALHARHLFPIFVPPGVRDSALKILRNHDIGVTVNYRSIPRQTYYRRKYGLSGHDFPVSDEWGQGTISLPLFPGLTEAEQEHVISIMRDHVAAEMGK
jgi:dTDP-4-amino-4,6-dideoxygalactose transaminase